jgi:hypothetical protein
MDFANAMKEEGKFTRTENGAVALSTTSDARLDLFGTVGALRDADENRITTLFSEAYAQDKLFATKIAFYARDIRCGLGERKTFRTIIRYMAEYHPEALRPNLDLTGVFGRYKWIKTADASSAKTRKLGIMTAQKLGYPVYNFKRIVRSMRKQIGVVESLMSAGKWNEIKYPEVPSRAMMIYRRAFAKHDPDRFSEFINKADKGEAKINASTLYPYDIVEKILYGRENNKVLEAQWKALPDYVEQGTNALIMADVSGSMYGRPMATSIGLAIYFAERNTGAYHNLFMTFSSCPQIVSLNGETLHQKIINVAKANWGYGTNLKAAFEKVLDIAEENNVLQEEMPKAIVVISDMEIDYSGNKDWTFYDKMEKKFRKAGYVIPNIIFWNVNSRHDVFHADATRKGVQLASGQSVTVFKQVLQNLGYNPIETMENIINSERYDCITIEKI